MSALVGDFQGKRKIICAESIAELESGTTDNTGVIFGRMGFEREHAVKKIEVGIDSKKGFTNMDKDSNV